VVLEKDQGAKARKQSRVVSTAAGPAMARLGSEPFVATMIHHHKEKNKLMD
jgi:hypothetical protein